MQHKAVVVKKESRRLRSKPATVGKGQGREPLPERSRDPSPSACAHWPAVAPRNRRCNLTPAARLRHLYFWRHLLSHLIVQTRLRTVDFSARGTQACTTRSQQKHAPPAAGTRHVFSWPRPARSTRDMEASRLSFHITGLRGRLIKTFML
jgi:hypothetical protein